MTTTLRTRVPYSIKRAVAKVLVNPLTGRIAGKMLGDRIRSHGIVVSTHSPLIRPEVKALLALGMYESAECRLVTTHLRRDLPVVELGASIGYISGQIGRLRPPRQVVVEANPPLLCLIQELLDANGVGSVRVVHGAISYDKHPTVSFMQSSFNTGGAVVSAASPLRSAEIEVPAFTLGELLKRERIGHFTLVCDIEGAEHAMIMNEHLEVTHACQQLIIELHDGAYAGRYLTKAELARLIAERWAMRQVERDGSNWVFQRDNLAKQGPQ